MNASARFLLPLLLISVYTTASAQRDGRLAYIKRYGLLAVNEMERTGIPASIKLAQGILESRYGTSELAVNANNHFGIKCGGSYGGATYDKIDDETGFLGKPIPSCFRVYSSAEESFVAHSEFLKSQRRYADLFELDADDYKSWAKGLKKAGYATNPSYHRKLIRIIEELELSQYDQKTSSELLTEMTGKPGQNLPKVDPDESLPALDDQPEELYFNDVRYTLTEEGQSLQDLAAVHNVPAEWLMEYNDRIEDNEMALRAGLRIYLQPKRAGYRGQDRYHTVEEGETMLDISHRFAVDLDRLYDRNKLDRDEEPATGAKVKLRGWSVREKPKTRLFPYENTKKDLSSNTVGDVRQNPRVEVKDPYLTDPFMNTGRPAPPKIDPQQEEGTTAKAPFEMTPKGSNGNTQRRAVYHTVKLGDTLWDIARRYGTSVDKIKELNGIESDDLRRDMRIRVQ